MLDAVGIRDCYVAMAQLVAQAPVSGFGHAAAGFLATVTGAARVQYWELSAQSDAFVLLGDAQPGDSLNTAATHRLPLRRDGRALCPFDLVAMNGAPLTAEAGRGHDLSRVAEVYGAAPDAPLRFVPLKTEAGGLFGCAVFGGVPAAELLEATEVRIAALTVVRLGQQARETARLRGMTVELSAALRRFDSEKRQQRAAIDRDLTHALPGGSPAMRDLRARVQKLARGDAPVLVTTPASDSAEPIARELHRIGPRSGEPFVVVHAATLRGDRLTVELFGHKRGVLPGVSAARRGTLREAGRGSVLIDRIEDLDPAGQEQILRLVQSGAFRPFGSSRDLPLVARLMISLRRDSLAEDAGPRVLPSLYFELKSRELALPPLAEAPGDALDILLAELARAGFDADEIALCREDEGVARALRQRAGHHGRDSMAALIRTALTAAAEAGEPLRATHLMAAEEMPSGPLGAGKDADGALPARMAEYEAGLIADALARFEGRRADAARFLAIPKRTLADKCLRYGL